jgi:hypothetical protein
MVDGYDGDRSRPHIVLPGDATVERYRPRTGGGGERRIRSIGNRATHARRLSEGLRQVEREAAALRIDLPEEIRADGIYVAVDAPSVEFSLALESLDLRGAGIELLAVQPPGQARGEVAAVFIPDAKTTELFRRLDAFSTQETQSGRPRHESLIANIDRLRRATLRELWTDPGPFPETAGLMWWELWLRRSDESIHILESVAVDMDWELADHWILFPSRLVAAVRTTSDSLGRALASRIPLAEVRRARLVESLLEAPHREVQRVIGQLADRVRRDGGRSPAVALLDTGIYHHSLFGSSLAPQDTHYVVGTDGVDRDGHGTELAGLALFGDLRTALSTDGPVILRHILESVKVLPDPPGENPKETYGAVTASGVTAPEVAEPNRARVYCLANSASNDHADGRPTLWSATVDALSFGTDVARTDRGLELLSDPDPTAGRLILVAAGNVNEYVANYLDVSDTSPIEEPAQAWNALTVGAFTQLDGVPDNPDYLGYHPIAIADDLSPHSRTSVPFSALWPIKPDIVMEGGNVLLSEDDTLTDFADTVSLITTSRREPLGFPLSTTNATSAAVAQAARLAAVARAEYPDLWPEAVRGLLVHAADWTPRMRAAIDAAPNKTEKKRIVRRYGFGVPTEISVLRSGSSDVTLIAQSNIQPFEQALTGGARLRDMHLHTLPWPRELLLELGALPIEMRITLSYFVEPNPSSRGWQGRYAYPSHSLRFDVPRTGESPNVFRARLNQLALQEEQTQRGAGLQEPRWLLGPVARHVGSLHADIWNSTAAELADSGFVGVYPVGGWWKNNNRADRNQLTVRYALLISLATPDIAVDLYTAIVNRIQIPINVAA